MGMWGVLVTGSLNLVGTRVLSVQATDPLRPWMDLMRRAGGENVGKGIFSKPIKIWKLR